MVQFIYPKDSSTYNNIFKDVVDTLDDGFSGWFSISSMDECNDYCFWQLVMELSNEEDHTKISYNSNNIADPHKITQLNSTFQVSNNSSIQISSHWTCALNAFQKFNDEDSVGDLVMLTRPEHFGKEFHYLRCIEPGEKTNDIFMRLSENIIAWNYILLLFVLGIFCSVSKLQSSIGKKNTELTGQDIGYDTNNNVQVILRTEDEAVKTDKISKLPTLVAEDPSHSDRSLGSNITIKMRKKYGWMIILVFLLMMSQISFIILIELMGVPFSNYHWLSLLTPSCSAINTACQKSKDSIKKPSVPYTRSSREIDSTEPLFSYLIVSDTQFDWFGNEFPELGKEKMPSICKEGIDTYESCSSKYGRYSNQQMKKAIEVYSKSQNSTSLIINGDLTSYFHPKERMEFETVFHKIEGLKRFYPSLGNHDYHHKVGATYGGDQWLGNPKKCNALHALDYIRGGFCGGIPRFPFNDIVRYDSKSLAYSWEEGPYHFVHTHFYPGYENKRIDIHSSLSWLRRDITLAAEANLTTILFIHSASDFQNNSLAKDIVNKENKVAAIFSGHSHRCLMNKCMQPSRVMQTQKDW